MVMRVMARFTIVSRGANYGSDVQTRCVSYTQKNISLVPQPEFFKPRLKPRLYPLGKLLAPRRISSGIIFKSCYQFSIKSVIALGKRSFLPFATISRSEKRLLQIITWRTNSLLNSAKVLLTVILRARCYCRFCIETTKRYGPKAIAIFSEIDHSFSSQRNLPKLDKYFRTPSLSRVF